MTQTRVTEWSTSGGASVGLTPDGSASRDSFLTVTFDGLAQGTTYTVSADIQVPAAQTSTALDARARRVVVYNAVENAALQSAAALNIAGDTRRLAVTFTVGANAPLIRLYNGSELAADVIRWDSVLITEAQNDQTYFDGSSDARTAASNPIQVVGYESNRESKNVFHDVLGGGQDAALSPAGLRTGTLTYKFLTEADAYECELMHSGTGVLKFRDDHLTTIGMAYVPDGSITRELNVEGRVFWLVSVAFREVIV
ncbi:hypothetical protein [Frigoribacterium faeni]|uniref:hypothetical protein n=1 Tax=Frigoribacterium faeni TaxID=145483 RepID=UPI0015F967CD|nr:hypothetical protein [Frigoribacterium faeni]